MSNKRTVIISDVLSEVEDRHAALVHELSKSGVEIAAYITPAEANLWHHATGASGEAGELLDAVKKHVIYKRELDQVNVIEELGDLEFYLQGIRAALGISREETLEKNIEKLKTGAKARYSEGYSDQAAQARVDKQCGISE